MVYALLTIVGILSAFVARAKWDYRKQFVFIVLGLLLGLILYLAIGFFDFAAVLEKGDASFWNRIPYLEIVLYFGMIAGMAAKFFHDILSKKLRRSVAKRKFFIPILVSPIVFGTIYSNIDHNASKFLLFIFAFQNGFFWQTILDRTEQ